MSVEKKIYKLNHFDYHRLAFLHKAETLCI